MAMSLSLSLMNQGLRSGSSAPSFITPTNSDIDIFAHSYSEFGYQSSFGAAGIAVDVGANGIGTMLFSLTGGKMRLGLYHNYAIASGTFPQAAANPRQNASGVSTSGTFHRGRVADNAANGSDTKGWDDINTSASGWVLIELNINSRSDLWGATTKTALETILAGISSTKAIMLVSGNPVGILPDGSAGAGSGAVLSGAEQTAYDAWRVTLAKYDFQSGDALSKPNVVYIDTFPDMCDPAALPNYRNYRGDLLTDGLHPTQSFVKRYDNSIWTRLQARLPAYTAGLTAKYTQPSANGLSSQGASQPFIHTNPLMTPGTDGSYSTGAGSLGTPPATNTIPQDWIVEPQANCGGFTLVMDKSSETHPDDGRPVVIHTFSGTLVNNASGEVRFHQQLSPAQITAAISGGWLATTDKVRPMLRFKVNAGSVGLQGVGVRSWVRPGTANQWQQGSWAQRTFAITPSIDPTYTMGTQDAGDGVWRVGQGPLMDFQGANLNAVTNFSEIHVWYTVRFFNLTGSTLNISATVRVSGCGLERTNISGFN